MAAVLSDSRIADLIDVRKMPQSGRALPSPRRKRQHLEARSAFRDPDGNEFRLILRQNLINPLDFSVILAFRLPNSNRFFRLRRYNGKSHNHRNRIEGDAFYDFHIHTATERYQELGTREDFYAEPTDRYGDYGGAIRCAVADCRLEVSPPPDTDQGELFSGGGS